MWWSIPAAIGIAIISIGIPMILDYLAEKKEDKNNDDGDNTNERY